MNQLTKDIDKIASRIDKISKRGKDNYPEYYSLIDELIINNKFDILKQTLFRKYEIVADDLVVDDLKKSSWPKILLLTNSPLQEMKLNLLNSFDIYQVGIWYYTNANVKLGWSKEVRNGDQVSVSVSKTGSIFGEIVFDDWDTDISYNKNIISIYTSVIEYLLED